MLELIGQHRRQSPASRAVGLDTRMSGGVFLLLLWYFVKFFVHSTKLLSQNRQSWSSNVFKTIFCTFQVMPVLSSALCCWPSPDLVPGVASAWSIHPCTGARCTGSALYMISLQLSGFGISSSSPEPTFCQNNRYILISIWADYVGYS